MATQSMTTGVRLSALVHFHSTGLIGTGAQQAIAHGLSFTPLLTIVIMHNISGGATWNLAAASDDVNVYPTVTNGAVYDLLVL